MRIAVFGAGGVGGYLGGRLAAAGEDVVLIARGEHLEALRYTGLSIVSPLGDLSTCDFEAVEDPKKVGPVDAVIVAVKSWQLRAAALEMGPLLGPDSFVVPVLNGVEATSELVRVLGARRPLKGLARIIAHLEGPGRVCHVGATPTVVFKEAENTDSERADRLREALEAAGVAAPQVDDIDAALWEKFLWIASVGGVGALVGAPIGVFREDEQSRNLVRQTMEEVRDLGWARGIRLPGDVVDTALVFIDSLPAAGTTSLQRDIAAGRPSELEAWNGAVVRLGRESGVDTPVNERIYEALLPAEREARGELQHDGRSG